jgi:hypothetical protein
MSIIKTIFRNVDATLQTSELAFHDLTNALPERRDAAIRNIIVFGRSVTFAIQKLKTHVAEFDDWYNSKQNEMKSNPLFKYLNEVRTDIIHEGKLNLSNYAEVKKFSLLFLQYMPKPANAISFFISDQLGGSGWIVKNGDAVEEKYYITLSEEFVKTGLLFAELPKEIEIEDKSVSNLCSIYLDYLRKLVLEAKERFDI